MSTGHRYSRESRRPGSIAMTMTEAERLQQAADTFTQQLALEKRRNVSLDDRISLMATQIHTRKETLKQVQANTKEQQRLQTRIEQLENELLKERQYLNQHLSRNQRLRDQVDVYRREKRAFLSDFRGFEEMEKKLVRDAARTYKGFMGVHDVDIQTAHELVRTKLKGESELNTFETQAFTLQSAIEQERKDEQLKVRQLANSMMAELSSAKDFVDMRGLLQALYEKWREATASRKVEIEEHRRNVEILGEAFEQIRAATGIARVGEVVTSFLKAEEQSYGLKRQIARLTTENDGLEDQLAALTTTFSYLKQSSDSQQKSELETAHLAEQKLRSLSQTKELLSSKADTLTSEVEELTELVDGLGRPGWELLGRQEGGEEFRMATAEVVLGRAEESMNSVLMYLSLTAQDNPLPSADLSDKDFTWRSPRVSSRVAEYLEEGYDDPDSPLSTREFTQRAKQRILKRAKQA